MGGGAGPSKNRSQAKGEAAIFMGSLWFPCLTTLLYFSDHKRLSASSRSSAEFFLTSLFPPGHIWVLPELKLRFFFSYDRGDMAS